MGKKCDAANIIEKLMDIFYFHICEYSESSESTVGSHVIDLLCTNRTSEALVNEKPHAITTLITLFLLQMGISYGYIGFYTLGLTYVDDNVVEHITPALIGK